MRSLTASFGLSTVRRADTSIHDTIARADESLYKAKSRGRNQVCVSRAVAHPNFKSATTPAAASAR